MSSPPPSSGTEVAPSSSPLLAAAASASAAASVAPVSQLYRHALESIFGFCSLGELGRVMHVSPDWRAAVLSMAPLHAVARMRDEAALARCMSSPLARHVSHLPPFARGHVGLSLDDGDLYALCHSVVAPQLESLTCVLQMPLSSSSIGSLRRLKSMRSLTVLLRAGSVGYHMHPESQPEPEQSQEVNELIEAIGHSGSGSGLSQGGQAEGGMCRLEELTLTLPAADTLVRFGALSAQSAPALRSFTFQWWHDASVFSEEQLQDLRDMRQLHSLLLVEPTSELVRRICQPAAAVAAAPLRAGPADASQHLEPLEPLPWQVMRMVKLDDGAADSLVALPALTQLAATLHCSRVDFLPHMRGLTSLKINAPQDRRLDHVLPTPSLLSALQSCASLTELHLRGFQIDSEHMEELLPYLPLLSSLRLSLLSKLHSLRCFAGCGSLVASLTDLSITHCFHVATSEFVQLHGLKSLQRLQLSTNISANIKPLSAGERAALTPPSIIFPKLTYFHCN